MTDPTGIHQALDIVVCEDAADAVRQGYNYKLPEFKAVDVVRVVVVQRGTEAGRPTVDFIVRDETGQKYVFMLTGRLLRAIPCGDSHD